MRNPNEPATPNIEPPDSLVAARAEHADLLRELTDIESEFTGLPPMNVRRKRLIIEKQRVIERIRFLKDWTKDYDHSHNTKKAPVTLVAAFDPNVPISKVLRGLRQRIGHIEAVYTAFNAYLTGDTDELWVELLEINDRALEALRSHEIQDTDE